MRLLRPAAICLILATLACVFAGCGGATHIAASGQSTAAATAASSPPTKSQAAAYAHAVNLRAADLPNMRITHSEHRASGREQFDHALAHCLGMTGSHKTITEIASPTFTGETEGEYEYELIGSTAEVERSEAIATADDAEIRSAHGLSCLRRFVLSEISKPHDGTRYAPPKVIRLANPLPEVRGSFGLRLETSLLSLPASSARLHIPIYVDVFGFPTGAVDMYLTAMGAPGPVPTESEQRLISLLYSRASATHL